MKTITKTNICLRMILRHKVLWVALTASNLLVFEPQRERATAASQPLAINYQQSLPPLSIESRTNGLRLRFSGNPGQRFLIQRAPAFTAPWTTITTRSTPSASTLFQYDVTNTPTIEPFDRITYTNSGKVMTAIDFLALPVKAPDYQFRYGDNPNQKAESRVPPSDGPHPVVILIHGGCWQSSRGGLSILGPAADALKASGFATW